MAALLTPRVLTCDDVALNLLASSRLPTSHVPKSLGLGWPAFSGSRALRRQGASTSKISCVLSRGKSHHHHEGRDEFHRRHPSINRLSTSAEHMSIETQKAQYMTNSKILKQLEVQLQDAVRHEDYPEATKLRNLMLRIRGRDPIHHMRSQLASAVQNERFEDAASLRDKLREVFPPPNISMPDMASITNRSEATTGGIRVVARSMYMRERSAPDSLRFFFAYKITIYNEGPRAVQLQSRRWRITDGGGRREVVSANHLRSPGASVCDWGPGVLGEQPIILSNTSFEYISACPLRTPTGTMEGEYEMSFLDEDYPVPFSVEVAPFTMSVNDWSNLY